VLRVRRAALRACAQARCDASALERQHGARAIRARWPGRRPRPPRCSVVHALVGRHASARGHRAAGRRRGTTRRPSPVPPRLPDARPRHAPPRGRPGLHARSRVAPSGPIPCSLRARRRGRDRLPQGSSSCRSATRAEPQLASAGRPPVQPPAAGKRRRSVPRRPCQAEGSPPLTAPAPQPRTRSVADPRAAWALPLRSRASV